MTKEQQHILACAVAAAAWDSEWTTDQIRGRKRIIELNGLRALAITIAGESRMPLEVIGDYFDYRHQTAVTKARNKCRDLITSDKDFARKADTILKRYNKLIQQ